MRFNSESEAQTYFESNAEFAGYNKDPDKDTLLLNGNTFEEWIIKQTIKTYMKTNFQQEIYSIKQKEKKITIAIFVTILAILGLSVILLSSNYAENNRAELEAKVQMYK